MESLISKSLNPFRFRGDKSRVYQICLITRQNVNKFRRMGIRDSDLSARSRSYLQHTFHAEITRSRSYLQYAFHAEIILEDLLGTRDMSMICVSVFFYFYYFKIIINIVKSDGIRALRFPLVEVAPFLFHDNFRIYKSPHRSHPTPNFLLLSTSPTRSRTHVSRATESGTLDKFPLYLLYVLLVAHYPGWGMKEECR